MSRLCFPSVAVIMVLVKFSFCSWIFFNLLPPRGVAKAFSFEKIQPLPASVSFDTGFSHCSGILPSPFFAVRELPSAFWLRLISLIAQMRSWNGS